MNTYKFHGAATRFISLLGCKLKWKDIESVESFYSPPLFLIKMKDGREIRLEPIEKGKNER